jgi:16S rRNA (guanine966-N2)-methyltransferase
MRIISGRFKNRNLKAGNNFRPSSDRVRETLFNIIQNDIEGCVFVDAFAGSGSVGIEALSRGARMVYFIESNVRILKILESNLTICDPEMNWRIYSLPVNKALEVLHSTGESPEILFFDPPYEFSQYVELLSQASSLFPHAILIVESSTRTKFTLPQGLVLWKERKIGETRLSFYVTSGVQPQAQG